MNCSDDMSTLSNVWSAVVKDSNGNIVRRFLNRRYSIKKFIGEDIGNEAILSQGGLTLEVLDPLCECDLNKEWSFPGGNNLYWYSTIIINPEVYISPYVNFTTGYTGTIIVQPSVYNAYITSGAYSAISGQIQTREVQYRWINLNPATDYYCDGTTKMYKQQKQVSYNGGDIWLDVVPAEYQQGGTAQTESIDCGYITPKWVATYADSHVESAACDTSSTISQNEITKTNLVSVDIKNCITTIGSSAFSYCTSLTSVTIPSGVTSIGSSAFSYCTSLTSIDIPDSVTSIGSSVFSNCSGLTSVTLGSGLTTIGYEAFGCCRSLSSVAIPASVTSITHGAFDGCSSLTSVTIPSSITIINPYVFRGCTSLTSITIPASVVSIGGEAFRLCRSLTSIDIPSGVTSIGYSAFEGCTSLTRIDIPSGVTSIGAAAFSDCSGLTSITVLATTPPTLANANSFNNTNNCPIYVPSGSVNAYKTATGWSDYADRIQPIT